MLIQSKTKFFDAPSFIDDIRSNNCEVFIPKSLTYCYYSLPKGHPECEKLLDKEDKYKLLNNLPILKEFLKKINPVLQEEGLN